MIGAIAFSIGAAIVSSHMGLPYLPMIAPNPAISGYIGFYAGVIALALIPLIALVRLAFKVIWGHKSSVKFKTALAGIWVVSFIIFLLTTVFTARNFVFETSTTEIISEAPINFDQPLNINVNGIKHHKNLRVSFGPTYLTEGNLISRNGVDVRIRKGDTDKVVVTKTVRARGMNQRSANRNTRYANHHFALNGNTISLDDYYKINKREKYRGQRIKYDVELPIGTQVSLNKSSNIFDNRQFRRSGASDEIWTMTESGLKQVGETIDEGSSKEN